MRGLCSPTPKPLATVTFIAVIFCTLSFDQPSSAQQPAPSRLITQAVNESHLTVLKGNTHPLARPQFDLGTAPATLPMQRMLLVLKRSPEQESALRRLLDNQQDKSSPSYHKWLTPAEFGKQFGPTDGDLQTITAWLQSHGFQVGSTKGRTVLEFSGSASQVQEAFHTTIHKYIVNGEQHWANASDPSIPTALTAAVAGVKTLHNFLKKPMVHIAEKYIPAKFIPKSRPQFTSSTGSHALTPEDYATIYNGAQPALSGIDGTGITIAVVARSNLFNDGTGPGSDVAEFRNVFGLPPSASALSVGLNVILDGPDPGDLGGDDELEATLDASWSGALATEALIDLVVSATTNTTDGIDLSELFIIDNNLGNVMTESFGTCELSANADAIGHEQLAEQAAAQGITYMVAAGDTGAEGCDNLSETIATGGIAVSALASTPFDVAVGGTMFNENGDDAAYWNTTNGADLGSAISYIPEDVWNETCTTQCQPGQPPLAAGGGGASIIFLSKPSWQSGVAGIPNDGTRDLPDVSLTAAGHDPYLVCIEGSCVPNPQNEISFAGVEGTSASAPSFAGIMALVDQKIGQTAVGPRQGLANYVLYPLALAQEADGTACNASTTPLPNSTCVFNDVTVGNNSVPGESEYPNGLYSSGVGYDLASGLGSVNVANLVNAWASATFRPTTTTLMLNGGTAAISIAHGTPVNVGISVVPNSGSGTPTGDVALIAMTDPSETGISDQVAVAAFTLNTSGTISGTTSLLPGSGSVSPYFVTAHYSGNTTSTPTGVFAPSDSSPGVLVTVTPENSTTTVSGVNQNLNSISGGTFPFGTFIFVRVDVAGSSGQGVPTGQVNFEDTFGNLPGQLFYPVLNPVPLNSQGNASIGAGVINFDAGNHNIFGNLRGRRQLQFEPELAAGNLHDPARFRRSLWLGKRQHHCPRRVRNNNPRHYRFKRFHHSGWRHLHRFAGWGRL
jgi:subtilase family serine protease